MIDVYFDCNIVLDYSVVIQLDVVHGHNQGHLAVIQVIVAYGHNEGYFCMHPVGDTPFVFQVPCKLESSQYFSKAVYGTCQDSNLCA